VGTTQDPSGHIRCIFAENDFDDECIQGAIAAIFAVAPEHVAVGPFGDVRPRKVCNVSRYRRSRGFCLQLDVYCPRTIWEKSEIEWVKMFAIVLRTNVLIPSNHPNPYLMNLVEPSGACRLVCLDEERYDSADEYLFVRRVVKDPAVFTEGVEDVSDVSALLEAELGRSRRGFSN
jgi:hypothetical protein